MTPDTTIDIYERAGGTTTRISTGPAGGNGYFTNFFRGASEDGTRVLFYTYEPLEAADTDTRLDLYERFGGTTTRISTGPSGGNGNFDVSFRRGASADGTRVFFETQEPLVAGDSDTCPFTTGCTDVYERFGGTTTLISTGPAGGNGSFGAGFSGASADGTRVFFETNESLVAGDTNNAQDVYAAGIADTAGYPRPRGATPMRVPLVLAYDQCTSGNRTHGPPLAFPSCNPPGQVSTSVTVGTPDANGAAANSIGSVHLGVVVGVPGPPDDSNLSITTSLTDVRCKGTTTACGGANTAGGSDYTGELTAVLRVRLTDKHSSTPQTTQDFPLRATAPCVTTASTSEGGSCSLATSANAIVPGTITDGKRAIWGLDQIQVFDGGPDGLDSTTPNAVFAVQGLFVS